MIRKNSIRTRFNRFIISTVSIIILLFTVLIIYHNVKQIEASIVHRMTNTVELSKINLSNALWQFNFAYINDFIESILLNEDMVYVAVYSHEEKIYEFKADKFTEFVFESFNNSNKFLVRDVELLHDDSQIGSIKLVMSKESIKTNIFRLSIYMLILMIAIISAIYFAISSSTNRFIFSPLQKFEEIIKRISSGTFYEKADFTGADEISKLAVSFNMMMDNLKTVTASRDELNAEISTRERAEESLRASEEIYRNLFEKSKDAILIIQNGKFIDCNQAAISMLRYKNKEEFLNTHPSELSPEKQPDGKMSYSKAEELMSIALKKGSLRFDWDHKKSDGTVFPVEVLLTAISDEANNQILHTVWRDITNRKRAEQIQQVLSKISNAVNETDNLIELYQLIQKQLGTIIDTTNFYIASYDEETGEIYSPYFIDENSNRIKQQKFRKNGVTEFIIRNAEPLLLTDDLRKKLIKSGEIDDYVWTSKTLIGVPLKIENKVIGCIVVRSSKMNIIFNKNDLSVLEAISNQTAIAIARKKAVDSLIETKQLSMAVIEDSPIGISVRDKFGTLILYNNAWEKIWGFTNEQVESYKIKRSKLQMGKKDGYLGNHLEKIKEVYINGGSYFVPEMELKPGKHEKAEWITQRFYAIKDNNDKVEKIVILTADISERKKADIVQEVLYNILHQVNTSRNLNEFFEVTHKELSKVIDTTNYFIALKNDNSEKLYIPYSRDEMDGDTHEVVYGKTLSSYVIKTGKPLLATEKLMAELTRKGEIENVGTPSKIWLGVPLILDEQTIGVIVVQSYTNPLLYTTKELEILSFVSNEIALAINKKRTQDQVLVQKTYFENLYQMSPNALVIVGNDDRVLQINQEFEKLFEYTQEEASGKLINDLIVPPDLKDEGKQMTIAVGEGQQVKFTSIRQNKNGQRIEVECIGKPIILGEDQLAVQAIYRDVSVQKRHEEQILKDLEEKKILLKEVHHRVKNNMQVISSMLKLQSRYIEDEKSLELFVNSQDRVKSMAMIHERIYKSPDLASVNFDDYVKSLMISLFQNYRVNTNNVSFESNIDNVAVDMNTAIPLGLIINELISNALKHGFPENREGKLIVSFHCDDGKHELIVEDNGVGFSNEPDYENPETLGLQLMNALTSQLQGILKFNGTKGTKVTLTF